MVYDTANPRSSRIRIDCIGLNELMRDDRSYLFGILLMF